MRREPYWLIVLWLLWLCRPNLVSPIDPVCPLAVFEPETDGEALYELKIDCHRLDYFDWIHVRRLQFLDRDVVQSKHGYGLPTMGLRKLRHWHVPVSDL